MKTENLITFSNTTRSEAAVTSMGNISVFKPFHRILESTFPLNFNLIYVELMLLASSSRKTTFEPSLEHTKLRLKDLKCTDGEEVSSLL